MDSTWWPWLPLLIITFPLVALFLVSLLRRVQMLWWRRSLVAFELRLQRDVTVEQVARWVGALRAVMRARRWWSIFPRWPVAVDTLADDHGVQRVVVLPRRLRSDVEATLAAVLPGARIDDRPDYLTTVAQHRRRYSVAAEAKVVGAGDVLAVDRAEDTSRHLLAALQPLETGESVRVRWMFAAARSPRILRMPGLTPLEIKRSTGALWAAGEPVLWATCRVHVVSRLGKRRARAVFGRVWAALRSANSHGTLLVRRWLPSWHVARRLRRWAVPVRRWPILATSAELVGLLGLVAGDAGLPGVPGGASRVLPPSMAMPATGLTVGVSNYPGSAKPLRLATVDRLRHTWILGPTGSGKSTLLANMIGGDITAGHGLVLIDAGGDLVADVLDRIPPERADDVIVIDPTIADHIVGFNPLRDGSPEQAAGFVYHVLQSAYAASWGPRTADIMRAALLTLTHARGTDGQLFTVIDVPTLLTDSGFRRQLTAQSLPPQLGEYWRWYDSLKEGARLNMIGPVLNKLRTFTLSRSLRALLGQSEGLQFSDVLAQNRIVLVPLKKGLLGTETSGLIGSLVMSAVWQAAQSRINTPKDTRRPFWLYVDEFQDVVRLPLDLTDMLAQARRLGLGLTLAHQYMAQLTTEVKTGVIGTTKSQIVFQLGQSDAKDVAPSFTPLTADDLRTLGAFEIALRPCVGGITLLPVTAATQPMSDPCTDGAALAHDSVHRWGAAIADVDAQIAARTATTPARGRRTNRIITSGDDDS